MFKCLFFFFLGVSTSLSGQSLRELAAKKGRHIGAFIEHSASMYDPAYVEVLTREFDSMPIIILIQEICPQEGVYDFTSVDKRIDFALAHGLKVRVGSMVWWNEIFPVAEWLRRYEGQSDKLRGILTHFIKTVMTHFNDRLGDQIISWDISNEPLENFGTGLRKNIWWGISPDEPWRYIELAYKVAHEHNPSARLFINEIFSERSEKKAAALIALIENLRTSGVSLNGVGIQMHQFAPGLAGVPFTPSKGKTMTLAASPKTISKRLKALSDLGLKIHLSEMDVPIYVGRLKGALLKRKLKSAFKKQAELFQGYTKACLDNTHCEGIFFWGFKDSESWIPVIAKGWGYPLLFNDDLTPKPGYYGVRNALAE